ncbi:MULTISPECIES: TadE family protein [Microbacterium]|uniref:TadE family protein n=1 Tax=Microbacterium TaxID=33882 RepID=UPI002781F03E|nr:MULTISPECIES: TadE family protein [Microbacterium]MDQ1076166.1 Flp pilus assembly protein TadG [Microbacterium sp. SORGH_AS_0969]MDQ1116405.1 Flp pilus assembly protein TadG [Microbacterium testaceum]
MRRTWRDERGSVTAEFAVAVPAVVIVLALCVGVLASAATAVRLQHVSAESARMLGRGDEARAFAAVGEVGASMAVSRADGLVCVDTSAPVSLSVPLPPVTARACALDGGE